MNGHRYFDQISLLKETACLVKKERSSATVQNLERSLSSRSHLLCDIFDLDAHGRKHIRSVKWLPIGILLSIDCDQTESRASLA